MAEDTVAILSPEFTLRHLRKLLLSISKLREDGMKEVDIMKRLKTDFKAYDGHTIRRLHELSLGTPVVDDFASVMKSTKPIKDGEIQVDATEPLQEVGVGSLVQYQGDPWCVSKIDKKTLYTLRRIR
jgi:hypothetical protein